jgi:hypothetical protein
MACSLPGDRGPSIWGQTVPGGRLTEMRQVASARELRCAKFRWSSIASLEGRTDRAGLRGSLHHAHTTGSANI